VLFFAGTPGTGTQGGQPVGKFISVLLARRRVAIYFPLILFAFPLLGFLALLDLPAGREVRVA